MENDPEATEQSDMPLAHTESLRLSDWIWGPWYAKLWWAVIPIYWGGRWAWMKVPALGIFYETLPANYLATFCNPFILFLILGNGYVRAKLDRGEWMFTADVPKRRLQPGDMSDPYTNPSDPRSGSRHLRHIGALKDGGH